MPRSPARSPAPDAAHPEPTGYDQVVVPAGERWAVQLLDPPLRGYLRSRGLAAALDAGGVVDVNPAVLTGLLKSAADAIGQPLMGRSARAHCSLVEPVADGVTLHAYRVEGAA